MTPIPLSQISNGLVEEKEVSTMFQQKDEGWNAAREAQGKREFYLDEDALTLIIEQSSGTYRKMARAICSNPVRVIKVKGDLNVD